MAAAQTPSGAAQNIQNMAGYVSRMRPRPAIPETGMLPNYRPRNNLDAITRLKRAALSRLGNVTPVTRNPYRNPLQTAAQNRLGY